MKKIVLIIILTVLICGCVLLGFASTVDKTNEDVKKYIESIGYQCNEEYKYKCSLIDEEGNLNIFELPKETGFSDTIRYIKKFKNGSYFSVRLGSYTGEFSADYKEKDNDGLGFSNLKKGKDLTCEFYEELAQGEGKQNKNKLKICEEDISLINEAKLYFEKIMEKSGVKL